MSTTKITVIREPKKLTFADLYVGSVFIRTDGTRTCVRVPRTSSLALATGGFNAVDLGSGGLLDIPDACEVVLATEIKVFL